MIMFTVVVAQAPLRVAFVFILIVNVHSLTFLWQSVIFPIIDRHQFYLHARLDLLEGRLKVNDWGVTAKLVALMVQAESGDFDPLASPQPYSLYLEQGLQLVAGEDIMPPDFLHIVAAEHKELKVCLTRGTTEIT